MHADCRTTTIEYMCTKFGVDSLAVFLLECGQTNIQTLLNALPTPAAIQPAWVITVQFRLMLMPSWCMLLSAINLYSAKKTNVMCLLLD